MPGGQFYKFGKQKFKCTVNGCTVEAIVSFQSINMTGLFSYSICIAIDDVTPLTCPALGIIQQSTPTMPVVIDSISGISKGKHSVATYLYVAAGTELYNYKYTYNLYSK